MYGGIQYNILLANIVALSD